MIDNQFDMAVFYIESGRVKPTGNPYVGSFKGKFRDNVFQ